MFNPRKKIDNLNETAEAKVRYHKQALLPLFSS